MAASSRPSSTPLARRRWHSWRWPTALLLTLAVLLPALTAAPPARAAGPTFTVNSLLDEPDAAIPDAVCWSTPSGKCTLRAAIEQAEWFGAATILLPAGTYVLTRGQLDVKVLIELRGAGAAATIVDGNGANPACYPAGALSCRVFDMKTGSTLIASGLTVRNGKAGVGEAGHYHGGAIHNHGRLELRDVVVSDSVVPAPFWGGGGITTAGGASAALEQVTLSGNRAQANGGGIENLGGLSLINATLSGNTAAEKGGGVWHNGGAFSAINSATIAGNAASAGGGGGLARGGGVPLYVSKTILAGNTGGNCADGSTPPITSLGYNLSSDATCPLAATGDRTSADPQLGPLQDNGGQTPTRKPAPTSPAVNAIPLPCGGTDQRGVGRPQGAGCDIGAVELVLHTLALSAGAGGSATGGGSYPAGSVATLTATPDPGYVFTGWTVDGQFAGWASPLTLTMNGNRTVAATFAARPSFPDVPEGHPAYEAISQLAARGVIRGYQDGRFGPRDSTLRAQMAALIARAMGWDAEDHGNPFPDRGPVDGDLWRNVGTLAYYNVARGYQDGKYRPTNPVLYAQTISFITRAMVTKGYWAQQPDNPALYANVPAASGHREDIATYYTHAGALPGTNPAAPWQAWDQPSTRGWFAQALWQALNSHFGVDRVD